MTISSTYDADVQADFISSGQRHSRTTYTRQRDVVECGKSRGWKKGGASKAMLLSRFSQKLPRKRNFLVVQGEFCKITSVVLRKICFLTV